MPSSVPHGWLIKALGLAKVPLLIIEGLKQLIAKWSTNVHLRTNDKTIKAKTIKYLRGIFQGDSLSVLLFILCVNPLSFMLNRLTGYKMSPNGKRTTNITNLFFVDDLKLYATNLNQMKLLLDLVTQFSNDIGMKFGESECAYQAIDKGKIIESKGPIIINNVTIKPMKVDESYKYLGLDENISYVSLINKERVKSEHFKRVKKIWKSELSGYNKHIAHNAFAVTILKPTFGLLDCTIEAIEQIDVRTRKILCITGNFHRNSDVDRLYIPRRKGSRGLKSIQTAFELRMISVRQHLQAINKNN